MWKWKQFLNLFFEVACPLCNRLTPETSCSYCWTKLQQFKLPTMQALEKSPMLTLSWGEYSGDLRRAIALLKYENHPALGYLLGKALGELWNTMVGSSSWIDAVSRNTSHKIIAVPIPMHSSKLRIRGYNQADIIAEAFCKTTNIRLARNGLKRIRETHAQFNLSVQDREKNLVNAFQPNRRWMRRSPNADILLIDDIYTTGTTARSASKALQRAGCNVLGIAAVARPQKRTLEGH